MKLSQNENLRVMNKFSSVIVTQVTDCSKSTTFYQQIAAQVHVRQHGRTGGRTVRF